MNEQEKFDRAVAVLVKAYFDDTLEHGSCTRCAVGNLIGAIAYPGSKDAVGRQKGTFFLMANGIHLKHSAWFSFVRTNGEAPHYIGREQIDLAEEQRAALGYTWEQIIKIEVAFENSRYNIRAGRNEKYNVYAMYDGMMAVVTQLAIIHGIDIEHTVEARELFKHTYSA